MRSPSSAISKAPPFVTSALSPRLKIFPVLPGSNFSSPSPTHHHKAEFRQEISPPGNLSALYRSANVFNPNAFQKLNSQKFWRGSARKSFVKDWRIAKGTVFRKTTKKKKAQSHPNAASPAASFPAWSCLREQSLPGDGEPPASPVSQSPPCPHTHRQPQGAKEPGAPSLLWPWQQAVGCSPCPRPGSQEQAEHPAPHLEDTWQLSWQALKGLQKADT